MGIKHTYSSAIADAGNPDGEVDSDDWNADHVIDGDIDLDGNDILNVGNVRERLSADRTYYVRSDGDDGNDGLTSGTAFLTLDRADEVITALDFAGYAVTMDVGAGTFIGVGIRPKAGGGNYFLRGAGSASTTLIEGPGSASGDWTYNSGESVSIYFPMSVNTYINGMTLASPDWVNLSVSAPALVTLADYDDGGFFSGTGDNKFVGNWGNVYGTYGARISLTGTIGHTGNALYFAWADFHSIIYIVNTTITLTGTPAFSSAFVVATSNSWIGKHGATITGGATGKRFDANTGGVIDVEAGSYTFFPGDVAGTVTSGGVYYAAPDVLGAKTVFMPEITTPAAPAIGGALVYSDDSGGKSRLMVRFPSGDPIELAIEP